MSDSGKAVFLSYASQDAEAARKICEALRSGGVEVWFDQNELVGGDAWDAKIRKQIKECALFVPVISANTQVRLEGYFRIEWKLAAQRTHAMAAAKAFVLPVVIDDTRDADAHVPEEFLAVQWTRLALQATQPFREDQPPEPRMPAFCARVRNLINDSHGARGAGAGISAQARESIPLEADRTVSTQTPPVVRSIGVVAVAARRMVGRDEERSELRAGFQSAAEGRGLLVGVSGEPGIGKTALVEDFLAELGADARPCIVARGRCSERLAGTEGYLPFLEALEGLLRGDFRVSAAQAMKRRAPTWFVQVASLSPENPADARMIAEAKAGSQERMKRELVAFLQEMAEARPIVLFFDDLHWADVSTIDLLAHLASRFQGLRLLLIVTYRPSDLLLAQHPLLQIKPDLQARGLCRELTLDFLSPQEIERYLSITFPEHRFPRELSALIMAKTEGSPLFMVDLVRDLRNREVITQERGSWVLGQSLPDLERDLPESVRGMIERKIAQLREDERTLLAVASVQGYEFDSVVVANAAGMDQDQVEERLETLERVHAFVRLVEEKEFPDRTLALRYRFVHVLYQNTLYGALRITRRAALSATVAKSLLGLYGDQKGKVASELAALFSAGRDFERAAEFYLLAAQLAAGGYANAEAVALAGHGLERLKYLPDSPQRAARQLSLEVTRALALNIAHGYAEPEVGAGYARARELCQKMGDSSELCQVLFGLAWYYFVRGELQSSRELAEQMVRMSEKIGDRVMLTTAHMMLGNVLVLIGEFQSARENLERSLSLYEPGQRQKFQALLRLDPGIFGLVQLGRVSWLLGYPEQARRKWAEASALATETGDPGGVAFTQILGTIIHTYRRECAQVLRLMEACVAHCKKHDIGHIYLWTQLWGAWAIAEQGATERGISLMQENLAIQRRLGGMVSYTEFLTLLAQILGNAGRVEEGLAAVAEANELARQMSEGVIQAETHRVKGELLLQANGDGAEVEAEACFQHAIEIARQQNGKSWELRAATSLARLWQVQGKREEARVLLTAIYGWFAEGFDTADLKDAAQLVASLS
jgi:predicted ATPase